MKSQILKTGDELLYYNDSIVLLFKGKRKVLSTSGYNGGYSEDLQAVYNHDLSLNKTQQCNLTAENYNEYMQNMSLIIGLNPEKVSAMGTTAQMRNAAVVSMDYEQLNVTAVVTGGVETNAGRAGDFAKYFLTEKKQTLSGTINIILIINADMSKGAITRALVTCTEAKTAALQELMVGSKYSKGLATGTGTDQTIIVANPDSSLYFGSAGKHQKIGELIGKTVITAVKEAISKQSNRTYETEHNLMRRLNRFGISEKTVFNKYKELNSQNSADESLFNENLLKITSLPDIFTYGILYIHLVDEYLWKLISFEETKQTALELINSLARKLELNTEFEVSKNIEDMKEIEYLLALAVKYNTGKTKIGNSLL